MINFGGYECGLVIKGMEKVVCVDNYDMICEFEVARTRRE